MRFEPHLVFRAEGFSKQGPRHPNEDGFFIHHLDDGVVVMVADGASGGGGGEASQVALHCALQALSGTSLDPKVILRRCNLELIHGAHRPVAAVLAVFRGKQMRVALAGDCECLVRRAGSQISVAETTSKAARRFLGEPKVEIDAESFELMDGDLVLLLSDGAMTSHQGRLVLEPGIPTMLPNVDLDYDDDATVVFVQSERKNWRRRHEGATT